MVSSILHNLETFLRVIKLPNQYTFIKGWGTKLTDIFLWNPFLGSNTALIIHIALIVPNYHRSLNISMKIHFCFLVLHERYDCIQHYSSTSMWFNSNHAVTNSSCLYSTWCCIQQWLHATLENSFSYIIYKFFCCLNINLTLIFPLPPLLRLLSLFLLSRPPLTPACYLHPPLPRAALTHRRTLPLICRLRPRPTPTLVSVS